MSESLVRVEAERGIRRLTLNRPDKLNALSKPLMEALGEALEEAAQDDSTRVMVLAGAGRSFCAGYDLTEDLTTEVGVLQQVLRRDLDRLLELFDHPKPIVARVQGHCLAGGLDLTMLCDLVVASTDAVFGLPEITFGSAPVANVLPWLVGARKAKELMLTGERIDGVEAHRLGLVNRVVPPEDLDATVDGIANRIAAFDPVTVGSPSRWSIAPWTGPASAARWWSRWTFRPSSKAPAPPSGWNSTAFARKRDSEPPSPGERDASRQPNRAATDPSVGRSCRFRGRFQPTEWCWLRRARGLRGFVRRPASPAPP
jgi:enoyl-CoA hydratase